MGSGIDKYSDVATIYDLLIEDKPIDDVVCKETSGEYHLIAANGDVTAAEVKLMELFAREVRLRNALEKISDQYEFIF
ncbi:ParA family protein, partial [Streptomyces brasiliscabiei]